MKAIVYKAYGPPEVLHLADVPAPAPAPGELLVRVRATSVNYGDLTARNFRALSPRQFNMPLLFWLVARLHFGLRRPKNPVLGSEFAGDVAAVGEGVTRFQKGDAVFGSRGQKMGAAAEYVCVPESGLVAAKPQRLSYEEAATIPYGAVTALSLLRKAGIQPGHKVLVNGASGSIGSFAVQLAKAYGAEVTGVCSTPRLAYVRALGADHVVDYTQADFTQNGESYDLIFDVLGKSDFSRCKRSLAPEGHYLLASFKLKQLVQMLWTARFGRQKVICALSSDRPEDLLRVTELVEAGRLRAIVDRCFPLAQAAAAHRYVEEGHKQGGIVLQT